MKRLALSLILAGVLATPTAQADTHGISTAVIATKTQRYVMKDIVYPDGPCDLAHRMDIAIVDGMLWECSCARLLIGYQCDWFLIAGVDTPAKKARRIRMPRPRLVHGVWVQPRLVIRVPVPA